MEALNGDEAFKFFLLTCPPLLLGNALQFKGVNANQPTFKIAVDGLDGEEHVPICRAKCPRTHMELT